MSRKLKNILMILFIVILVLVSFVTMNSFKSFDNKRQNFEQNDTFVPEMPQNENGMMMPGTMTPPEKPENSEEDMFGSIPPEFPETNREITSSTNVLSINFYLLIVFENILLSLLILYLIMSGFNKKSLKETFNSIDKIVIYLLSIIILTILLTLGNDYLVKNVFSRDNVILDSEKTTTSEDIEKGVEVVELNIDLSKYSSNITITKAGEYTLSGEFNHSIIIDANDSVTLNFNNVTIKNDITAAIANISLHELIINLEDNTTNVLSDGGSSEYDGCLYSIGPLTIQGNGSLEVYGNQEDGEGIATETNDITITGGNIYIETMDDGINAGGDGGLIQINNGNILIKAKGDGIDSNQKIEINGGIIYAISTSEDNAGIDADAGITINEGLVIALGNGMLESPLATSKQNSLSLNLNTKINAETLITLLNENEEVVVSFEAIERFKTLIISSTDLKTGNYSLYEGGTNTGIKTNYIYNGGIYTAGNKITINNNFLFSVN